tara:strand:+ start:306 stop:989 length:684 start_codon:yes stop_codon:yes gene_type:complete
MDKSLQNRYLRNKDLIDQSKLKDITVIGAGGIGSALLQNATIMGFSPINLWDDDTLEEHNLSTTSWPQEFIGKTKVEAAFKTCSKLNDVNLIPHEAKWRTAYPLSNKVFLTPDNMEVRKAVYDQWVKMPDREFLVDMRMGALGVEIITVTRENDYFMESWQPSNSIPDESCTAKHTIFCGSLAASFGLSQAFNVLQNRPYYAYIWGSLSPVSFRREHLVKNQLKQVA